MGQPFFLGGQAVIEGVMMRSPHNVAVAVRRANGEIVVRREPVRSLLTRCKFLNKPMIRGVFALFEALILGMRALNFSAAVALADNDAKESDPANNGQQPPSPKQAKASAMLQSGESTIAGGAIALTVVFALAVGLCLFVVVPNLAADLIRPLRDRPFLLNLAEGLIRLVIFLAYIIIIGFINDIRRVFQYHGAEHKVVWTVEKEKPLKVEIAREFPIAHPRCGTSFVFVVLLTSILIFAFLGWNSNIVLRVLTRIALLPVIAGISYEFIRFAATRQCNWWVRTLTAPGLALQRLTTRTPNDNQIEVAIKAMEAVLNFEKEPEPFAARVVRPEPVPA